MGDAVRLGVAWMGAVVAVSVTCGRGVTVTVTGGRGVTVTVTGGGVGEQVIGGVPVGVAVKVRLRSTRLLVSSRSRTWSRACLLYTSRCV